MALLVLAYPQLDPVDYEKIQAFRKQHDELYFNVVEPHFTIVFPTFNISSQDFIPEVAARAESCQAFDFCLRCATLNKDSFSAYYHAFLVPDEGFSTIIKLHDRLYSRKLFPQRALDVDFIPHLGVGNALDSEQCLAMVAIWNDQPFEIKGRVSALEVVEYENDQVHCLQRIQLLAG